MKFIEKEKSEKETKHGFYNTPAIITKIGNDYDFWVQSGEWIINIQDNNDIIMFEKEDTYWEDFLSTIDNDFKIVKILTRFEIIIEEK